MPRVSYVALTSTGDMVTGACEAPSIQDALTQLRSQGLTPIDVSTRWSLRIRRGVTGAQAAQMLRRIATVVGEGGAPLTEVLPSLADEEQTPQLRSVLSGIRDAMLRESVPMSRALARYPEVFPDVVVKRIAAGEAAGGLAHALDDAASFLENAVRTKARIIGALTYPGVLLFLAVAIITALSMTVMPKFAEFYASAHVALPLVSRLVIGGGQLLAHFWFVALGLGIWGTWAARRALLRRDVRRRIDYILWAAPGVRRIIRGLAWARWARVMALLYAQGVPLLEAIELACQASGTAVIRDAAPGLVQYVGERGRLKEAMERAGVFPPMLRTSIGLGEQHGTLGRMLKDAAEWYAREAEGILDQLPNILQPVTIVLIGGLIGMMLLSLYLPMFQMYNLLSRAH